MLHCRRATAVTSLLFALVVVTANWASGQVPDKFSNLRFFPKDISKPDLMAHMRGFSFALDVRCSYCHVERSAKELDLDFASDDKPAKKTARLMLAMVTTINHDYVGKIGKTDPIRVECATCHRGLPQPKTLKATLSEAIDKQGIEEAIAVYRDLRSRYYGTGQYDFGESQLNQLTEVLLRNNKNKQAAALMEMNFEANHPTSIWSYHLLAMSHQANGEKEKARADYKKVVELYPQDSWAKKQLDSLTDSK